MYGMSIVTIQFSTLILLVLLLVGGAAINVYVMVPNNTTLEFPSFIHFFPLAGGIMWFITGKTPDPLWVGSATVLLTGLASLHLYLSMDWIQRKELLGRKLRNSNSARPAPVVGENVVQGEQAWVTR
jgi:peptidoglycan/LPS O-acetylase OafA/YrhL